MLGRFREPVRAWTDPVGRALFRVRLRPNHLTVLGFGVSVLAASAFVTGQIRSAGLLLIVAGLCDFFDGALARVSGQVTAFGAFLDSVIDRYSDLVVMLGIVVLFARTPNARGAVVAMAGLIGSMMVSYTKARAESVGITCTVGMMERPERLICLIAGALANLLEPALWVLAVLSNLTALQRIAFTRRMTRDAALLRGVALAALLLLPPRAAAEPPTPAVAVTPELERAWAGALEAYRQGEAAPLLREFASETARRSPIGDHVGFVLAEALARDGDLDGARATALAVADGWPEGRLAPRALLLAATLAFRADDDAQAEALLARLAGAYQQAPEMPNALYLLAMSAEARGARDLAAQAYRQLQLLLPASGYADAAGDRLAALEAAGLRSAPFTTAQRLERAERLLRGGVPAQATEEAERIAADTRADAVAVRALRIAADASKKLGRWESAARALERAIPRAPASLRSALQLERGRLLVRAGRQREPLALFAEVAAAGGEVEASEALYQRGRLLEDANRPAEAADAYRVVLARFPSREMAAASAWRLGWLAWLEGDARAAAERWARLAEPGGAYRVPALYWTGRCREQLGARAEAERLYREILGEAPRTYYGVLAASRAPEAAAGGAPAQVTLPAEPAEALAGDPAFARVELLRRVGLVEDAVQELEELTPLAAGDPARLYGVSSVFAQAERYHLALRIFRRYLAPLAASGDPGLPRAFWEIFYPFAWRAELTEAAVAAGLDPYLVAAVVREESSYYPRAVSRSGARGLMQLMTGTAALLAPQRDLDDPAQNLKIGARFLAALVRDFGDTRLALAAYNAGPQRARRWWTARRTDDVEAFIEQIPYEETRFYVKKVVLSWDEYRRIYGGR